MSVALLMSRDAVRARLGFDAAFAAASQTSPTPAPDVPFVVPTLPPRLARAAPGWLESVWVCVGFGVVALVVCYFLVVRPLLQGRANRGRGSRLRIAAGIVATTLLLVTSAAAGVNTYVGYVGGLHELWNRLSGGGAPAAYDPGKGPASEQPPPAPAKDNGKQGAPALPGKTHPQPQPTRVLPTVPPVAVVPLQHSKIVQIPIFAPAYGLPNAPAYVYLPAGYSSTGKPLPLLMLIGGAPGSTDDWLSPGKADVKMDALVAAHIVKPYVIVMPTTNPSFFQDNECLNTLHGPQVESYLIDVVLPTIEQQLNVDHDRHLHAIAGFSAGADCALNVGLHHLDQFSAIATMEAEGSPGAKAAHLLDFRADLIAANSPRDYIPTMTFTAPLVVYINSAGGYDRPNNDLLQTELQARGVYVYRHDEPDYGHNWRDARADLPYMLTFISAAFSNPPPPLRTGAPLNTSPVTTAPVTSAPSIVASTEPPGAVVH